MSIFGRPLNPRDYQSNAHVYSYTPPVIEPTGRALDKVRERAWDLACQYAYTTGKVDMEGYSQLLEGNPYRELEGP